MHEHFFSRLPSQVPIHVSVFSNHKMSACIRMHVYVAAGIQGFIYSVCTFGYTHMQRKGWFKWPVVLAHHACSSMIQMHTHTFIFRCLPGSGRHTWSRAHKPAHAQTDYYRLIRTHTRTHTEHIPMQMCTRIHTSPHITTPYTSMHIHAPHPATISQTQILTERL